MKTIQFIEAPEIYFDDSAFVVLLTGLPKNKDELLQELCERLQFPEYFGFNWDALYDCLRDFNWIEKKGIVLVHIEIPKLSDDDLRTYIEILIDAVNDWKEGEDHYFKVIFPEEAEQVIKKILNSN